MRLPSHKWVVAFDTMGGMKICTYPTNLIMLVECASSEEANTAYLKLAQNEPALHPDNFRASNLPSPEFLRAAVQRILGPMIVSFVEQQAPTITSVANATPSVPVAVPPAPAAPPSPATQTFSGPAFNVTSNAAMPSATQSAAPPQVAAPAEAPKETCPSCGGKKAGRGFSHAPDCKVVTERAAAKAAAPAAEEAPKETCPSCGGKKAGRGFSHAPDCKVVAEREAAKASEAPKETCPSCGGKKAGRGFSHAPDCKRS